jgi:hypothetical protein
MTSEQLVSYDSPSKGLVTVMFPFLIIGIPTVILLCLCVSPSRVGECIRGWYIRNPRRTTQAHDAERNWVCGADQPPLELQRPERALIRRTSDISLAAPRYEEALGAPTVPPGVKLMPRDGGVYVEADERPPSYRRSLS